MHWACAIFISFSHRPYVTSWDHADATWLAATIKYNANDAASLCKFSQTFASFCNIFILFYCSIYMCSRLYSPFSLSFEMLLSDHARWSYRSCIENTSDYCDRSRSDIWHRSGRSQRFDLSIFLLNSTKYCNVDQIRVAACSWQRHFNLAIHDVYVIWNILSKGSFAAEGPRDAE